MPSPYIPQMLPLGNLDWAGLVPLIGQASYRLGEFDSVLDAIPNPLLLLSPLTRQEAVLSSRIEGTQTTLEEVLRYEASQQAQSPTREEDIREIINYVRAMGYAWDQLNERPISLNLIREIHSILLDSVRGKRKGRGEFRRVQNWIGGQGVSIEKATYVPPSPERVMEFLDNWEKYIHYEEKDRLVQLAIIHAQFEIIHPFVDGNGRVGRIMLPLFLYEKELLKSPIFYISAYLESHRGLYYDRLFEVSHSQDWESWIEFFLTAVSEQASSNTHQARQILDLYNDLKQRIGSITGSKYALRALETLFQQPFLTTTSFTNDSGIPRRTALRIIDKLKEHNVLSVVRESSGAQAEELAFPDLVDLLNT
jgi:Fic family protein